MFTGIVKEVGKIGKVSRAGSLIRFEIKSMDILKDAEVSDSISVNGVCLTLIYKKENSLSFEAMPSTLKNTNLKRLKKGDFVNLEPALSVGDKLGGHFVLGHVDAEVKFKKIIANNGYWRLEINLPLMFRKSVVVNGSIAIEGISLTVKKISAGGLTVDMVPFTYNNTNMKHKKPVIG